MENSSFDQLTDILRSMKNDDGQEVYGKECIVKANQAAAGMKGAPYSAVFDLNHSGNTVVPFPGVKEGYQAGSNPKHFLTKQKELAGSALMFCMNIKEESGKLKGKVSFASKPKHGAKVFKG